MLRRYLFILFYFLLSGGCFVYGQKKTLKLSNFKHKSIWIYKSEKSRKNYCITGCGFQMAPPSAKTDSIIDSWIGKHPDSKMFPIYSKKTDKVGAIVYCWVVDNADTLNLFLVKNGVYPEQEMHRIQTWDELSEIQRTYSEPKKEYDKKVKILCDSASYSLFLIQLKNADKHAKQNKLGIWSTK